MGIHPPIHIYNNGFLLLDWHSSIPVVFLTGKRHKKSSINGTSRLIDSLTFSRINLLYAGKIDLTGSMVHIWWHCPVLKTFWSNAISIASSVKKNTNTVMTPDPKLALLGIGMDSWPFEFHMVVTHIFIAARLTIARLWKQPSASDLYTTIHTLNEHATNEYMFAKAHLSVDKLLHK